MRYRPRSSVTTILMNRVGRSVVSAITQTPASGPFALVTTPPISLLPMSTAALVRCGVLIPGGDAANNTSIPSASRATNDAVFICPSSMESIQRPEPGIVAQLLAQFDTEICMRTRAGVHAVGTLWRLVGFGIYHSNVFAFSSPYA